MALSVTASQNQKTWDATVRVTGGHPLQLWGIGESQRAAEPDLQIDRVVVRDASERMVGYGQLQIRREKVGRNGASVVVAECLNVHSNRASTIPELLDALAECAATRWDAALFSAELDAPSSPELVEAVRSRGWQRTGTVAEGDGGPRRLRVSLGTSEADLASRLSEATLDRCRAGLRVSDVAVREVTERSGDVRAAGLKTQQISHLLHELGQDSLLLVATQERPGQEPVALGYLWFVHTVGQAMLYRVGFTRSARELGIDDALLLTGAVELQKRGVQRLDGGDVADPDVPTVVRELADVERVILGSWRKPLISDTMADAPAAGTGARGDSDESSEPSQGRGRRGLFGRRRGAQTAERGPESSEARAAEPERTVAASTDAAADRAAAERRRDARRQVSSDLGVDATDQTPAVTSDAAAMGADSRDAAARGSRGPDAGAAGTAAGTAAGSGSTPAAPGPSEAERGGGSKAAKKAARRQARAQKQQERAAAPASDRDRAPAQEAAASDARGPVRGGGPDDDARPEGSSAGVAGPVGAAGGSRGEQSPGRGAAEGPEPVAAAVRPAEVRVQQARREREMKAEHRRAERVALKAEQFEAEQKAPKEPLGKRLRREAGGAIRDALGR
ncbi:hypothetical protein [Kocuria palustris]|uniref:hypothetical protein n=1 Tax=Kocuria palustris TaxID=71999 RepID=UPI0011A2DAE9|nr:hypothetical protein [Kocuria palustris]